MGISVEDEYQGQNSGDRWFKNTRGRAQDTGLKIYRRGE
jgi:hypothetical protein